MSELSTFNSLNRAATGVVSSAIELAAASFIDAENKEIDEMFERLRKDQPEVENVSDNKYSDNHINNDRHINKTEYKSPITEDNSYRVSFKNETDFQSFQLQMKTDNKQIIASPVKIGDIYIAEVKREDAAFINEYAKTNNIDIVTFNGLDIHTMYSETGGRTESDIKDNLHENQGHAMSGVTNQLLMNCDTLGSAVFYARQAKDFVYDGSLTETIEYKFNNAEDMIKFNDAMKEAGIETSISESALGSLTKAPEYKIELNIQTNSNNSTAIADSIDKMNTAQEILALNGLDDKVAIKRQEFNARQHRGLLNGGAFDDYAKDFNKSMAKQAVNLGFDKDYLTLNAKSDVLSNMLDRLNVSELKDLNDGIEKYVSKYQDIYKVDSCIVVEGYLKNIKSLDENDKKQLAKIIGKAVEKDSIKDKIKKDKNEHIKKENEEKAKQAETIDKITKLIYENKVTASAALLNDALGKMSEKELADFNKFLKNEIAIPDAAVISQAHLEKIIKEYFKDNMRLTSDEKSSIARIIAEELKQKPDNVNSDSVTDCIKNEINERINTIKASTIDGNIKLLKSIDKRFNMNLSAKNAITRSDILQIDKKFFELFRENNINILDKRGRIDVNKINELINNPKLLGKLNISKEQLEIFKATAVNPGGFNKNGVMGTISSITNKLMSGDDPTGENQKTMQEINQMVTSAQRTKEVVKSIKKADQIRIGERKRIRNAKTPDGGSKPHTTHNKPKKKDEGLGGKLTDKQIKQSQKTEAKLASKVKWADRYEKSIFGKYNKFKNEVIQKLAKTPVGQAIMAVIKKATMAASKVILPALGAALGLLLAIVGAIDVIIIIVLCISSLMDAINPTKWIDKALEPNSYADTVMYNLYEMMEKEEENWVKDLYDTDNVYKKKDDLQWGSAYTDLKAYCNSSSGVGGEYLKAEKNNGKTTITVSPFYFEVPDDVRTKVTKFEDEADVLVSANRSIYSTGTSQDGVNVTAQSGHTSNIKDILCMMDVNFNDINNSDDESLKNILGMSPAGLNWDNFKNNIKNGFKWIKAAVSQIWDDDAWTKFEESKGITVKYDTLKNYCMTLFENSHQECFELEVSYDDLDDCNNKTTGTFYLGFNGNNIGLQTIDTTYGGRFKKFITERNCATHITTNNLTDKNSMCLKEDMGDNKDTYDFIKSNDCWNVTSDNETGFTTSISRNAYSSSVSETVYSPDDTYYELPVFQDIDNRYDYRSILEDIIADGDKDEEDREYSGEEYDNFREAYQDTLNEAIDTVGDSYLEQINEDDYKDEVREKLDESFENYSDSYYFTKSSTFNAMRHYYYTMSDVEFTIDEAPVNSKAYLQWYYYDDDDTGERYYTCRIRAFATKRYQVTGKAELTQYCERIEQNCKGHKAQYCGGHVKVDSTGIVYSITNEQIAITGMLENDITPVAKGYDIEANLGSEIYGKLDGVDYSSLRNATITGNSNSTGIKDREGKVNIQASSCSKGLNLLTKTGDSGFTTWGKWGSDTNTYTRTIDMKLAKDIFDIDCCILYGRNVFPIKAENWQTYEGWTSDNMTMVVNKYLGDWQELYGFDIPENIGMCKIPEKDIDAIIEALKSKYGDKFTESRQEAVRFALSWVGRGQYNNKHHSHGFLMDSHTGKVYKSLTTKGESGTFEFNCTATDCSGFGSFYLNHFDKLDHVAGTWELSKTGRNAEVNSTYSNLLPGDLILKADSDDHTMIFIGVLDNDLELNVSNGTKKVLTNGSTDYNVWNHLTLAKGQPITVDCAVSANASHKKGTATRDYSFTVGNIYLRGASDGYYKSYGDWLTGMKIRYFDNDY